MRMSTRTCRHNHCRRYLWEQRQHGVLQKVAVEPALVSRDLRQMKRVTESALALADMWVHIPLWFCKT